VIGIDFKIHDKYRRIYQQQRMLTQLLSLLNALTDIVQVLIFIYVLGIEPDTVLDWFNVIADVDP